MSKVTKYSTFKPEDLFPGRVIDSLTVVRELPPAEAPYKGHKFWEFRCACGNLYISHLQNFNQKQSKNCSKCGRPEARNSETGVAIAYAQYRNDAKRRGRAARKLAFHLSYEEFKDLILKPCAYCGCENSREIKTKFQTFRSNGVDRIDNTLGYVPGNVISCCRICNRAKDVMTADEFLSWARRIARRNPPKFVVNAA